MLINNIVCSSPQSLNLKEFDIDYVPVEWYEVSKKILHKVSSKGVEVGIRLENDHVLKHGDVLNIEGNKALLVEIPECPCIAIKAETLIEMGKACYEMGNRHAPLFYQDSELLMPFDDPTLKFLKKCGLNAYKKNARLINLLGGQINGHSHSHSHEHSHHHSH